MSLSGKTRRAAGAQHVARCALACATVVLSTQAFATDDGKTGARFAIQAQVIAGGGTTTAASACFDLDGTIGQPVVGRTSGGPYVLDAGFWVVPAQHERIFGNGFEIGECDP